VPIDYAIDATRRLVLVTVYGALTVEEALAYQRRVRADPAFDPTYAQVCDLTGVTSENLSSGDLQTIAINAPYEPGARRAFVVRRDLGYGLGRMFQTFSASEPRGDVRIFRDIGEAMRWALEKLV
jgi:hypothetical protein